MPSNKLDIIIGTRTACSITTRSVEGATGLVGRCISKVMVFGFQDPSLGSFLLLSLNQLNILKALVANWKVRKGLGGWDEERGSYGTDCPCRDSEEKCLGALKMGLTNTL